MLLGFKQSTHCQCIYLSDFPLFLCSLNVPHLRWGKKIGAYQYPNAAARPPQLRAPREGCHPRPAFPPSPAAAPPPAVRVGGAAAAVRVRSLTSLVPISEALQGDIDCDLHLLVYTDVLQPLGPGTAPRATLSRAAPAAAATARSRRPRGDAARPGHGPEGLVTPPGSGQACGLTANDRDSGPRGPRPGLDRSTHGLRCAEGTRKPQSPSQPPQQPRRRRRH